MGILIAIIVMTVVIAGIIHLLAGRNQDINEQENAIVEDVQELGDKVVEIVEDAAQEVKAVVKKRTRKKAIPIEPMTPNPEA